MKKQAKVTSKGQVTIPREIRRRLGVRAGDKLEFEEDAQGVRVKAVRDGSVFEKYAGIGNPGIGKFWWHCGTRTTLSIGAQGNF